jgi:environmental stress-induced protein Ves
MVWKLLKPADYVTSQWSGGTTTQLAIYPETAVYADRDFLWRLSSAKVEQETSVFTSLPDYNRFISVLHGELALKIEQEARKSLPPLGIRAFSGADHVESWGICQDFNLMVRKGNCEGEMHALRMDGTSDVTVKPAMPATEEFPKAFLALFCAEGKLHVPAVGVEVGAGELLLCQNPEPLQLNGEAGTAVMEASIRSRQ